jgi:hypothetical protein
MRDLTNIELDAVGGGDGLVPVWMNTVTKFINSIPINNQVVANDNHGWQGFGNFTPNFNLSAYNQNV